jgi:hypothetical protein
MAKAAPKAKKPAVKAKPKEEKPASAKTGKSAKAEPKTAKPAAREGAAKTAKAPQKAPGRSTKAKAGKSKGSQLQCDECGLVVTIDEECDCAVCDVICCGSEMSFRQ